MDRNQIVESIGEEIARLQQVRDLLTSGNGHHVLYSNGNGTHSTKKRNLSEDARNRIAEAQKRRWAKHRKEIAASRKS
jgi:hypothetical protein